MKLKGIVFVSMFILSMICIIIFFITNNNLFGFVGYLFLFIIQLCRFIEEIQKKDMHRLEK